MPTTAELITACERAHKVEDKAAYTVCCGVRAAMQFGVLDHLPPEHLAMLKAEVVRFDLATEARRESSAALHGAAKVSA